MRFGVFLSIVVLVMGHSMVFGAADPDTARAFCVSGDKLLVAKDFQNAKLMYERALGADSGSAAAHLGLGQALQELGSAPEAMKHYLEAEALARTQKNFSVAAKAHDAGRKLGPGLMDLSARNQRLVEKLLPLAERALADGQFDTALAAYNQVLVVAPNTEGAAKGLKTAQVGVAARGDPVKEKVAASMLTEVWYYVGTGDREKASQTARSISQRYQDTAPGKEAAELIACNFHPKDVAAAVVKMKQQMAAAKPVAKTGAALTAPVRTPTRVAPSGGNTLDVDALETQATAKVTALPKEQLAATFNAAFAKGKGFYGKATPGTEGNQQALASALEQFILCEACYLRMDHENLTTGEIDQQETQASMLRYACMKMHILSR